jgi:hypothetical protein
MEKLQPVRGTKDLFGEDYDKHEAIISIAKRIASLYGYQGISTPIFEFSNIFKRSLGESSDVVGKEMAEKIMAVDFRNPYKNTFTGEDLDIGGEGMKGFYDKIIPASSVFWWNDLNLKLSIL